VSHPNHDDRPGAPRNADHDPRARAAQTVSASPPAADCDDVRQALQRHYPEMSSAPSGAEGPPVASSVDRSFMTRRQNALSADVKRDTPFAEGLRHLQDWEAALVELCRREPDPDTLRMLSCFRERRPEVIEWLADTTTARVLPFPGE
jgi:hypothetical protein